MQLYTHYYVSVVVSLKGGSMPPKILGTSYMGYFQDDMAEKEPGWAGPLQWGLVYVSLGSIRKMVNFS